VRLGAAPARATGRRPRLARPGGGTGGLPAALARLQRLLDRGRAATADHWPPIRRAYGWVHQAAHLLANRDGQPGAAVHAAYQALLGTRIAQQGTLGALAPAGDRFRTVTASYAPGLFHCYDVPHLPPTNNALEQYFGAVRYHERRATGRTGASPGLVVRGAVRVVAAVAARGQIFDEIALRPTDLTAWQALRQQLRTRQDARCAQRRFRQDPDAYLSALEDALCRASLPA